MLLGLTSAGGAGPNSPGDAPYGGTVFSLKSTGTDFAVKKTFIPSAAYPAGSLVRGSDNYFYGMTTGGGTNGDGTIFRLVPNGALTVIRHLHFRTTGSRPQGSLVQGPDGSFYGMTYDGGSNLQGTVFKISPTGALTVLHHFNYATTGAHPEGSLVRGRDDNFYGMTSQGGAGGAYQGGTIFKITPAGALTVLRHLVTPADGGSPKGGMVQASDGYFYGMTTSGGVEDYGTLFKISATGAFSVLATVGNKTTTRGTPLHFTAAATDPDAGQAKTFSLVNAPAGASICAATGAFSWTPAATGTYTFAVKVTDNGVPVLSDSETITVTVTAPAAARLASGAEQDAGTLRVSLYPNPVADQLTVLVSGAGRIKGTAVTDAGGNVQRINGHRLVGAPSPGGEPAWKLELDVAALRPGLYLLRVESDGEHRVVKFLKQ